MEEKIIENKVQCKKCGDVVSSNDNNISSCKCGFIKITGGFKSLQRGSLKEGIDYIEMSKFYLAE